jgi:hypothetical protein
MRTSLPVLADKLCTDHRAGRPLGAEYRQARWKTVMRARVARCVRLHPRTVRRRRGRLIGPVWRAKKNHCAKKSCRYHLGSKKYVEQCSLFVADRGGISSATMGALLGLTRQRADQIIEESLQAFGGKKLEELLSIDDPRLDRSASRPKNRFGGRKKDFSFSESELEKMRGMQRMGFTLKEIARPFKCSLSTIWQALRASKAA